MQQMGVPTIAEPAAAGLNGAVHIGAQQAAGAGADRLLILPSDLPYLTPADVEQVCLAAANPGHLIICPDRHRLGTNALCLKPQPTFPFSFGLMSFQKHRQAAVQSGRQATIIHTPGWQFDVDTVEDWHLYQQSEASLETTHCQ